MIGTVLASGTAATLAACASAVLVLALLCAVLSLRRSARDLRLLADQLAVHASEVLGDVEEALARARGELDRVEDLVGSAEAIADTVASASRVAHAAFTAPLIKVLAIGAGTARAGRRLRGTA